MDGTRPPRNPVDAAWEVDSPSKLAAFLVDLARRARTGRTRVENPSSVAMIEASGACGRHPEGIQRNGRDAELGDSGAPGLAKIDRAG